MLVGLLGTILALLCAGASAAFPARLQVGEANGTVELDCGASPEQPLSWKPSKPWMEDGAVRMEPSGRWKERVRLTRLDVSMSGNYSCHAGPSLLGSVFLAVRDPALPIFDRKGGPAAAAVTCEAKSFDGTFNCSWKTLHPATFRVLVSRRGRESGACPARDRQAYVPGTVWLVLRDCSFCPFGEPGKLQVKLQAVGEDGNYDELTTEVFLPGIVKPASPDRLLVRRRSSSLDFSWTPPASWPRPSASFPLHYHLQLQTFGQKRPIDVWSDQLRETWAEENGQVGQRVQIRCRDPFLHSPWSDWSAWASVSPASLRL